MNSTDAAVIGIALGAFAMGFNLAVLLTRRERPARWVAGLGALLALVSLLWWAPGLWADVGYRPAPGTQSCWGCTPAPMLRQVCYPMDLSARPWGPTGDGRLVDVTLKDNRYCGGSSECRDLGLCPIGMYAEDWGFNAQALRNACLGGAEWLQPGPRDCEPTLQEQTDLQYTTSRLSSVYERWGWRGRAGGSPERPHAVTRQSWVFHGPATIAAGVCEEGDVFSRPLGRFGWRIHYRVDWLPEDRPWCEGRQPPPSPPSPPPPPVPEPEPEPTPCPPTAELCAPACGSLADVVESLLAGPRRTILPDGTGEEDPDGRYLFVPRWMEERILRLAPDCEASYCPGIPSTGRLEIELEERP